MLFRSHRAPGSSFDAANEPVACAALGSHLDNYRHAPGRRLDLVRARFPAARLRRPAKIRGCKRSGRRGRLRSFRVQGAEAFEPASAALPNRAALLVEGSPARSIFLSFGSHDDRFSIALVISYFYPSLKGVLLFLVLACTSSATFSQEWLWA